MELRKWRRSWFQNQTQAYTSADENAQPQELPEEELSFPDGHCFHRLYTLWRGNEEEKGERPFLTLWEDPQQTCPLSARELQAEGARLIQALGAAAEKRWKSLAEQKALDEGAFLYLDEGRLMAWLLLFPPVGGGEHLTIRHLYRELVCCGVVSGVNRQLVERLPELEERYFRLFPIACGKPAVDGADGQVIDRYSRKLEPLVQVDEMGHADYVSLKLVQNIKKGEIICELVPPVPGQDGETVTGKPIPAHVGAAVEVPQGRNTSVSPDHKYLISTRDGHVEFTGLNFQVKPILEIEESVDRSRGIVNYLGDIHIRGDVCRGAVVRAMGNIQVDGVIEGCTIEAGENLIVSSGIQGQGDAVIRAHESVYAKYLERCSVYARESVEADCIIDCDIYSNGCVKARTGRGVIIGGTVRSAELVTAATVGSKAEKLTTIELGGLPCEEAERLQLERELEQVEQTISQLEQAPDSQEKNSTLSKLRLNLCVARMKLEKFDKELNTDGPSHGEHSSCRLVCDAAYPGTVVQIGHDAYRVRQMERNCTIGMADGFVRPI